MATLYKAPQPGKAQELLRYGFQPKDFPYNPPFADGQCYFAAPDSRRLAEDYNSHYQQGILEVEVDPQIYAQAFKPLETPYQGGPMMEVAVPHALFATLNTFPRVLKSQ